MKKCVKNVLTWLMMATLLSGCGGTGNSLPDSGHGNSSNPPEDPFPIAPEGALQEVEGASALVSKEYELLFQKNEENKFGVWIAKKDQHEKVFFADTPASIKVRGEGSGIGIETYVEKVYKAPYDSLVQKNYGYLLSSTISTNHGSKFLLEDSYFINNESVFGVSRVVKVITANAEDKGFASIYSMKDISQSNAYDDFYYFIPGILYKDSSHMVNGAIASNLDLDKVYVKETRTGLPMIMGQQKASGNALGLMHLNPKISVGENIGGGVPGEINGELQYGSLGVTILPEVSFDFCYPCTEGPNTYDAGQGQSRKYHPVTEDFSHTYQIGLIPSHAEQYNDVMTDVYKKAYDAETRYVADIDIDEIYEQNIDIFVKEYREYTYNGKTVAAGFPWSLELPNGTNHQGVTFQMGFVGQQIPAAYQLYRYGLDHNDESIKKKGESILDFWCNDAINANYFPTVWWDPSNTVAGGTRRNYPSFLRCMVDGLEGMLDAYRIAKAYGNEKTEWYEMVYKYATNLVNKQNDDGSFYRAYKITGAVETDTSNGNTQGTSKLNTPIAVRFLGKMYELTKEEKFKEAAVRAAEFCYQNLYVSLGKYVGGTPDNPNTVDKEAAVYALYCFDAAFMLTGEQKYLKAAEHAAVCALSWTYVYDFAIPSSGENDLKNPFKNGGVIGFSLIATGHSGADNYSAYLYYEMFKLYVLTENEFFKNAALLLQNDTKLCTDYDGRMGFKHRAMMPEASNVSDFSFSSVGTWLPWSGVANLEPITNMEETFHESDIRKMETSIADLKNTLNLYGCGGNALSR